MTNGFSHPYHLDGSTFIFRGIRSIFFFIFISLFDENDFSKQNNPKWDAAFFGVTSGAILFAYVLYGLMDKSLNLLLYYIKKPTRKLSLLYKNIIKQRPNINHKFLHWNVSP